MTFANRFGGRIAVHQEERLVVFLQDGDQRIVPVQEQPVIEVLVDPLLDDPLMSEKSATIDCSLRESEASSISIRPL